MIKAEEIINKQFSRAFWGYDIGEVDTFLDEIVRANERAEQELEIAQLRIRMLLEELEHYTGKREDAKEATGQKAETTAPKPVETDEKKENAEEKNTMSETVTIRYVAPEDVYKRQDRFCTRGKEAWPYARSIYVGFALCGRQCGRNKTARIE